MLDGDMADQEQELSEFESIAHVLLVFHIAALANCRPAWCRRNLCILLIHGHGIRVDFGSRRAGGCLYRWLRLPVEHSSDEILDEPFAEEIRSFSKSVYSVDGLLRHSEPVLVSARVFHGILELLEERIFKV